MEIDAKLEVEHPLTEMITVVDIVEDRLRATSCEEVRFKRNDIETKEHIIETRIYAEDPVTFQPSPGNIRILKFPKNLDHIRIDNSVKELGAVLSYYNLLLFKVIIYGPIRSDVIVRLRGALNNFYIVFFLLQR